MIDYILLAEFDDLKGKIIRYSYPQKVPDLEAPPDSEKSGSKYVQTLDDKMAEMIIPDTGNDRMIDTVFFMINKPKIGHVSYNLKTLVKSRSNLWSKIFSNERKDQLKKFTDIKISCHVFKIIDLEWVPIIESKPQ